MLCDKNGNIVAAEIKHVHEETISLCGNALTHEFYFKSIDQAVINAQIPSSNIKACRKCVSVVINCLAAVGGEKWQNENEEDLSTQQLDMMSC